jgi:hypothetical protein
VSERLYTEEEVARLQESEVKIVLEGLLRNLQDVRAQRAAGSLPGVRQGEIWGLDTAIKAVRRRLR